MIHRLRHSFALSAAAVALFAAPVFLDGAIPLVTSIDAHAGKARAVVEVTATETEEAATATVTLPALPTQARMARRAMVSALLAAAIASIGASVELQDLTEATGAAEGAEAAVAEAEEDVSPEALEEALLTAANKPVTDDVVVWVSEQLGIGDADGLIDDYLANR